MLIFKKEEQARNLVLKHVHLVDHCLKESRNALEEFLIVKIESASGTATKVGEFEASADTLVREIREVLLDGAFLPHIRSDVYRLVEAVDSIAGVAEEISQFIIAQVPKVPDEFHADLLEVFQQSLNCFHELRKALEAYFKPKGMYEDLREHFTKVCDFESDVDELQTALTRKIFSSSLALSEKMHLQQLVKKTGNIADLAEDAADELEFAAMKSVV